MKELFFIGGGKMATAIAAGVVRSGLFTPDALGAFDPSQSAADEFARNTGIKIATDSPCSGIEKSATVIVAVKPQVVEQALGKYRELLRDKLLISIAAGVSVARLAEITGAERIIRVMPNTPALVGCGAAAFAAGKNVLPQDIALVERIFSAVGTVCQLKESDLDAVTALSGSGPAYAFEFIQSLADGGVAEGLSRDTALLLAAQTLLGAAQMVLQTREHPTVLKDKVTSPAGTTSRGLEVLEEKGFSGAVIKAVRAAASRSRELGKK